VKDYIGHISHQSGRLSFVAAALFDTHVLEFAGLEHFAAFQAFHVFGVLLTAHDLDAWVFAGWALNYLGAGWRHFRSHKSGDSIVKKGGGTGFTGISRYFRPVTGIVKGGDAG
jgi:hypothetical protein